MQKYDLQYPLIQKRITLSKQAVFTVITFTKAYYHVIYKITSFYAYFHNQVWDKDLIHLSLKASMYCSTLQRDLSIVGVYLRLRVLLTLFLSILYTACCHVQLMKPSKSIRVGRQWQLHSLAQSMSLHVVTVPGSQEIMELTLCQKYILPQFSSPPAFSSTISVQFIRLPSVFSSTISVQFTCANSFQFNHQIILYSLSFQLSNCQYHLCIQFQSAISQHLVKNH